MSFRITTVCASPEVNLFELMMQLSADMAISDVRWLEQDMACDVVVEEADSEAERLREIIARHVGELPIDWLLRPLERNPKKLLLCDMDSTVIQQECIDEMAAHMGIKDRVACITESAMRGELEFEDALRERVRLLEGLPIAALEQVWQERIDMMPGARSVAISVRAVCFVCWCLVALHSSRRRSAICLASICILPTA